MSDKTVSDIIAEALLEIRTKHGIAITELNASWGNGYMNYPYSALESVQIKAEIEEPLEYDL